MPSIFAECGRWRLLGSLIGVSVSQSIVSLFVLLLPANSWKLDRCRVDLGPRARGRIHRGSPGIDVLIEQAARRDLIKRPTSLRLQLLAQLFSLLCRLCLLELQIDKKSSQSAGKELRKIYRKAKRGSSHTLTFWRVAAEHCSRKCSGTGRWIRLVQIWTIDQRQDLKQDP